MELRARYGGLDRAAEASGLSRGALESWSQGRKQPRPRSLCALQAAAQGRDPEEHERLVALMAERFAQGLEPFTGRPAPARRSCAEVVRLFLAADEDLAAQAAMLDLREDAAERREREALARGETVEDEGDEDAPSQLPLWLFQREG